MLCCHINVDFSVFIHCVFVFDSLYIFVLNKCNRVSFIMQIIKHSIETLKNQF